MFSLSYSPFKNLDDSALKCFHEIFVCCHLTCVVSSIYVLPSQPPRRDLWTQWHTPRPFPSKKNKQRVFRDATMAPQIRWWWWRWWDDDYDQHQILTNYWNFETFAVLPRQRLWSLTAGLDALDLVAIHDEFILLTDLHVMLKFAVHGVVPFLNHRDSTKNEIHTHSSHKTILLATESKSFQIHLVGWNQGKDYSHFLQTSCFIWYAKYSASVDISTTPTTSNLVPKRFWSQMAWHPNQPKNGPSRSMWVKQQRSAGISLSFGIGIKGWLRKSHDWWTKFGDLRFGCPFHGNLSTNHSNVCLYFHPPLKIRVESLDSKKISKNYPGSDQFLIYPLIKLTIRMVSKSSLMIPGPRSKPSTGPLSLEDHAANAAKSIDTNLGSLDLSQLNWEPFVGCEGKKLYNTNTFCWDFSRMKYIIYVYVCIPIYVCVFFYTYLYM